MNSLNTKNRKLDLTKISKNNLVNNSVVFFRFSGKLYSHIHIGDYIYLGGARGVMVIVVGNGHSDTSSNPGRDWLHFTNTLGKGMNPIILPPVMGK